MAAAAAVRIAYSGELFTGPLVCEEVTVAATEVAAAAATTTNCCGGGGVADASRRQWAVDELKLVIHVCYEVCQRNLALAAIGCTYVALFRE